MARLVFNPGDTFTIGAPSSATDVFGSSGKDTITIAAGANATLFGFDSTDAIALGGNAGAYTAVRSGSSIILTTAGGSVTIPVSTTGQSIAFGDATRTLVYNTTSGNVELGGQAITTTAATVTAGTGGSSTAGQTFTLTTGVDKFTGGDGNDSFNALATTLTGLDVINGGAGSDTLTVDDVAGDAATFANTTVSSIETLVLNSTKGLAADLDISAASFTAATITLNKAGAAQTVTASTSQDVTIVSSAAQTVNLVGGVNSSVTGGAAVTAEGGAGTLDISAKGQVDVGQGAGPTANTYTAVTVGSTTGTIKIDDNSGTAGARGSKLTSVTITAFDGAVTLDGSGITSVSAKGGTADNITINSAAGTRALSLTLDNVATSTVTDGEATSLTVSTTGKASTGITLTAAKATSLAINADEALTVTALTNSTSIKTITTTGDSLVTVTAAAAATALTSIDASASTGGIKIDDALGTGVAFTGSAKSDTITVGATTKAVSTGDGDDTVTMSSAVGLQGSVDAGAGTDTLSMTFANAATVSANATFEAGVSGFEKLSLGAITDVAASTVALANLDDISDVTVAGAANQAAARTHTISGNVTGGTVKLTALLGTDATLALTGSGFAAGTADSFNLVFAATDGFVNAGALTLANVETVNITVDDTDTTAPTAKFDPNLDITSATKLVVSGDAGITFANSDISAVTNLDASGLTKTGAVGGVVATLVPTTGVTASGGAGDDTLVVGNAAAGKANTINGNGGADSLTGGTGVDTINGGDGNDTIAGNGGADTLNGDAGNDGITGGAGVDTINGGAGDDTIDAAAGNDVIGGGAGNDQITGGTGQDTITLGGGRDVVTFAAGDSTTATPDTVNGFGVTTVAIDSAGTGVAVDLDTAAEFIAATAGGAEADLLNLAGAGTLEADATGAGQAAGVNYTVSKGILTLSGAGASAVDTLGEWLTEVSAIATQNTETLAFEFGGDTYVFQDGNTDILVKLAGVTGVAGLAVADASTDAPVNYILIG